ncbi:histidine kinase [Streptomyces sp. CAU 1734]|uniref:sensor histidine kinase n=1 Tax=Streptomyces sp. CAU 1734 TaxID=3140360 RepID=UPI0032611E83
MLRRERVRDTLADIALWGVLSAFVAATADTGSRLAAGAGIAVVAGAVLIGRRWPLVSLIAVTVLCAAENPQLHSAAYSASMLAFGYLTGRRSARARPALITFGVMAVSGPLLLLAPGRDMFDLPEQLTAVCFTVVVPWLLGQYVRQYAELVRTGWELADRMEREQRAVADRERIRERSRIAGDMHDSLGHDLALIAVRAAALEVDRSLPERQREAAGELRRSAADATGRLRDIVGVLRTDGESAPVDPVGGTVRALVERARESGLAVTLAEEGEESGALPEMTALAVLRVVQESLTNAAKHAPGAEISVRVGRAGGRVTVSVMDTGAPGAGSGLAGGGSGLVGLDERVRLAGGTLGHGPRPGGGFEVVARLPADTGTGPRTPVAGPVTTSARELTRARRQVRRRLVRVITVPVVVTGTLGVTLIGLEQYRLARTVLEPGRYDSLRIGDTRAETESRLPEEEVDRAPSGAGPEPAGVDACVYYRTTWLRPLPAYRLCYRDGRLAAKAKVVDVDREEERSRDPGGSRTAPAPFGGAAGAGHRVPGAHLGGVSGGSATSPGSALAASSG